jgi:hypothetical protein
MSNSHYQCPSCHSEDIVRYPALYIGETSNLDLKTSAVGIGSISTKGTSQTIAADWARPPEKKKTVRNVIIGLLLTPICGFTLLAILYYSFPAAQGIFSQSGLLPDLLVFLPFILFLAGTIFIGVANHRWNKYVYPKNLDSWQHTYYCKRCGRTFLLEE